MNDIIIRDLEEKDLPVIKSLIVEAWGEGWNFRRYDQNTDFFQALLEVYLSVFLNSSTFGKAAIMDGKVAGVVLASVNGETEKFRLFQKDIAPNTLTLLSAAEAERKDVVEHLSVSFNAIGRLLENRLAIYGGSASIGSASIGSLEFIAVSKQAQGLKIGKALWNEAAAYFISRNVKSIYLIADSQCNVGFYDHNGFSKADTKQTVYNYTTGQKKFDIFLYEYRF